MASDKTNMNERKICLVTGAGKGIGQAVALRMTAAGNRVFISDYDPDAALSTLQQINEAGFGELADMIVCDVTDPSAVQSMIREIDEKHQRLDILVHCAAIQESSDFFDITADQWRRVVDVNLFGTFCVCQAAASLMRDRADPHAACNGKIITLTSVHDSLPRLCNLHYDASKAGVSLLTREMALALADWRINVNAVAPGVIDTPMNQSLRDDPLKLAVAVGRVPWGRVGTAAEVAKLIAFLASDSADYMTGAIIPFDGGRSLYNGIVTDNDSIDEQAAPTRQQSLWQRIIKIAKNPFSTRT